MYFFPLCTQKEHRREAEKPPDGRGHIARVGRLCLAGYRNECRKKEPQKEVAHTMSQCMCACVSDAQAGAAAAPAISPTQRRRPPREKKPLHVRFIVVPNRLAAIAKQETTHTTTRAPSPKLLLSSFFYQCLRAHFFFYFFLFRGVFPFFPICFRETRRARFSSFSPFPQKGPRGQKEEGEEKTL